MKKLFLITFIIVFSFSIPAGAGIFGFSGNDSSGGLFFAQYAQAKSKKKKPARRKDGKKKKKSGTLQALKMDTDGFLASVSISVRGDAQCRDEIARALRLLQAKNISAFGFVMENIGTAECAQDGSGIFVWEKPARYKIGRATLLSGDVWLAGTFVHESGHAKLYREYQRDHPGNPVPPEIYSGAEAEKECLAAQYSVLKGLGAEPATLAYLEKMSASEYWKTENRWW